MKALAPIASAVLPLLALSCQTSRPVLPAAPPAWTHEPGTGRALEADWWNVFGDPHLHALILDGWRSNPELDAAFQQVESARADRFEALSSLFPTAKAAAGFREGREQNRMTDYRPEDLEPWTAEAAVSWELDLAGKQRARLASAKAREEAAFAQWRGVQLLIATEIAAARFEDVVLSTEIPRRSQQLADEEKALAMTDALVERGLAASSDRAARLSETEVFRRELSNLEQMRETSRLRLFRLCGGAALPDAQSVALKIPPTPSRIPAEVWGARPDLLAAEAEVRAAFSIHDAARLDLLPSLSLVAGGFAGKDSLGGQLKVWEAAAGPRLEIPVWDPSRIAEIRRTRAAAASAAANYRSTALRAIEEIEGAFFTLSVHHSQFASLDVQSAAQLTAWNDARAKTASGVGSFIEEATAGRDHHDAALARSLMQLLVLNDYLLLVRALGG